MLTILTRFLSSHFPHIIDYCECSGYFTSHHNGMIVQVWVFLWPCEQRNDYASLSFLVTLWTTEWLCKFEFSCDPVNNGAIAQIWVFSWPCEQRNDCTSEFSHDPVNLSQGQGHSHWYQKFEFGHVYHQTKPISNIFLLKSQNRQSQVLSDEYQSCKQNWARAWTSQQDVAAYQISSKSTEELW